MSQSNLITSGSIILQPQLSLAQLGGTLQITPAFNLALTLANMTGGSAAAGQANQYYGVSTIVANGTPLVVNFNTFGSSNDPMGNAYAQLSLKLLLIQNLGYVGSTPVETDLITVSGTGAATALTTLLMTNSSSQGFIIGGPASGQVAPFAMFFNPGATAIAVATSTGANELTFTSTASGRNCTVNIVAIGSLH